MKTLLVFLLVAVSASSAVGSQATGELEEMLTRIDRTATDYSRAALSFSCQESIRWIGKEGSGRRDFNYVVAIDENGVFEDYRTLDRKREANALPARVEPRDHGVPSYLRSAYLWVFIFKRDRWPHHHYEIMGKKKLYGRPATLIRFEPKPPYRVDVNNWFGTAWVDRETAQLLKVVAHRPKDEEELKKIEQHAAGEAVIAWSYVVEITTTEFTAEERGQRLPGRVEQRSDRHDFSRSLDASVRSIRRVQQLYTDYRFFEVKATESIGSE